MFQFSNQTVFIVSPERWGTMKVSKHHYALELAARECKVYFIEPPDLSVKGIVITDCQDHKNIKLVRYKPIFRAKRFLPSFVFLFLIRLQINKLISAIGKSPEIVWSFQGYLFHNLKWFHAKKTIFFAADQFYYSYLPHEVFHADVILSVSDTITKRLQSTGKNVEEIGHGLQKRFVEYANELLLTEGPSTITHPVIAGYTGNMRMEALDRATMRSVILSHPEVKFIFWGSYKAEDLNLGGLQNDEANAFIEFLESQKNVELRGAVPGEQLQQEMKDCDLFWLCWKIGVNNLWDGSNSHKLLEYLSTGKPVVAHHVSSYKHNGLLYMLPSKQNQGYLQLFTQVIEIIKRGEERKLIHDRLLYAVNNSYSNKVQLIEHLLTDG